MCSKLQEVCTEEEFMACAASCKKIALKKSLWHVQQAAGSLHKRRVYGMCSELKKVCTEDAMACAASCRKFALKKSLWHVQQAAGSLH